MTCSSETSHGAAVRVGELRATARIIGVGPQAYSMHRSAERARARARRSSGAVTRPRSPRLPSSVASTTARRRALEQIEVEQLGGAARAVEQRRRRRRARAALRRASTNGARPTPPATIHASAGGSTGSNGRPSGPRQATRAPGSRVVEQRRADADALVEERDAGRRAGRVAQDLEDRERPAQQRIRAARRS